ncbi:Lipopolysaccharide biosynthesis protein, LPS:glycosyltransferase [Lachnospiraceae bacterium NLAE-zl-G231]|nr:Lipopolysaccharide biosynthesis protein, LPS:glycosyltransferase [Lachnospiraceae bacterium NLAE-zl-G231]
MNIVYHLTDNYARISGTSIISVFENNKDIDEINVYLIENGFTRETKQKFIELAEKYGRKVFFENLPDLNTGGYNLGLVSIKKEWMFDSYSRLFLDKLLPHDVDKVIYLDGDVLVLDSLQELWDLDLSGKCCAACMDCISKPYYNLFGIDEKNRYCNSGVILIDLKVWREKEISEKVKNYVHKNNGYVFFMEQTVFNAVLQDECIFLPFKYNVSTLVQVLSYKELIKLRKPLYFYSEAEVKKAKDKPIIIHMTGFFYVINRAWNEVTNHPDRKRFVEYSSLLDWDGPILQKDKRNWKTRLKDLIIHGLPRSIVIGIVSFLYNNMRVKNIRNISKKIERKKEKIIA